MRRGLWRQGFKQPRHASSLKRRRQRCWLPQAALPLQSSHQAAAIPHSPLRHGSDDAPPTEPAEPAAGGGGTFSTAAALADSFLCAKPRLPAGIRQRAVQPGTTGGSAGVSSVQTPGSQRDLGCSELPPNPFAMAAAAPQLSGSLNGGAQAPAGGVRPVSQLGPPDPFSAAAAAAAAGTALHAKDA